MLDDSLASHLSLIASSKTADASLVPSIIYDQASSWSSIVETPTGYNATGPSSSDISLEETVVSSGSYYNNSVSFTEAAGDKVTIRFQGESWQDCLEGLRLIVRMCDRLLDRHLWSCWA